MRISRVPIALTAALLGAFAFSNAASAVELAPQTLTMSTSVTNACTLFIQDFSVDAAGVNWGQSGWSTYIGVMCNQDTPFTVSMDSGENFGKSSRQPSLRAMTDGAGHYLPYQLFTDATLTTPLSGANVGGVGNGDWQWVSIGISFVDFYSYVPGGAYSDHVNVTLSFN